MIVRTAVALVTFAAATTAQVTWTQLSGTGAPMAYGAYAADLLRSRLVAFGGEQGGVPSDITREWNPVTNGWSQISPTTRPSARRRPSMAYDEARAECVLFGGGGAASGSFFADTWTWNGTTWTQRSPATTPPPRFGAAMAYDSLRQVVVMFGGFVPSGLDTNDLWEWDGTNWTQRIVAGGPSPRGAHRMAFDSARGVTVLFGGYSTPGLTTLADTWTWNGTTWSSGPAGPGSLCDQLFVYDAFRQRTVLFGGLRIVGPTLTDLNQTWEWNGASWTQRTTATTPSARNGMACGFLPYLSGRVLSAGGGTATGTQFGTSFNLLPATPATVVGFGTGCPTTGGPVQLDHVTLPYIGSPFLSQVAGGPPSAPIGILAFGASNTTWSGMPLPLNLAVIGAPGCQALISLDVLFTVLLSNGAGTVTWNLPNDGSIVGLPFYMQSVILDPLLAQPFQIGASSGRQFTVGSP